MDVGGTMVTKSQLLTKARREISSASKSKDIDKFIQHTKQAEGYVFDYENYD